jgi:hypothetical protein
MLNLPCCAKEISITAWVDEVCAFVFSLQSVVSIMAVVINATAVVVMAFVAAKFKKI